MSVVLDIARTYRAPAAVLRHRVSGPPEEARALIVLMLGCGLMFVSRMPGISRQAFLDPSLDRNALMGAALLGWVFIAPLAFYLIAPLPHLVARTLGGRASWYEVRMALFWALLASAPLWLLVGLVEGFIGQGMAHNLVGVAAGLAFFLFWGAGLREVERGPRPAE